MSRVRARVLVSGHVQGVWFRESTRREAERLVELNAASGVMGGTFRAIVEAVRGSGKPRKS